MSNEQASSVQESRPWIVGPWCVQSQGEHIGAVWSGTDPETHGLPLCAVHAYRGGVGSTDWLAGSAYMRLADAQLVALAPELAEAVLSFDSEDNDTFRESCIRLNVLAAKLRAIGGTDD